ncbi:MAG TPA: hypothetical protein PLI65_06895 [Bacteroidales bacterium]|nr:hypothetical protein [Bacteroidales bacterium]HRW97418.1 hypothetical protein [Bacteroidales bacterium]
MKKLFSILIVFLILQGYSTFGQNAVLTIPDVYYCDSTTILVPVNAENLINVAAMSLDISFDTLACSFISLKNISPQFAGLLYNMIYGSQTKLRVLYSNMNGTNLPSGKLFDIELFYKTGQTNMDFLLSFCELTNPNFQIIPTTFNNGSVNNLVTITGQPQNQTVYQPETATFVVEVLGNPTYQWQQSINNGATWNNLFNTANIQGVNMPELTIIQTSTFYNGWLFRCFITHQGCSAFSETAGLTVLPPLINQVIELPAGWSSFSTYVNPLSTDFDEVLATISSQLIILISGSQMYFPSQNINTLKKFDPKKGYTVKLSAAAPLTITGNMQSDKTISLPSGWSHLPVLSNCEISVSDLFGAQLTEVDMIKEIAGQGVYWPELNIITLPVLEPGRAYMVRMNSPVQITFPACN